MAFRLGTGLINKIWLGTTEIKKAYLGTTLIHNKSVVASSFSGSLNGSGSTATIVGASRNYNLGAGNTGRVQFRSLFHPNAGSGGVITYNKAGAGNTDINENDIVTFANGDSCVMRAMIMLSGTSASVELWDVDTNTLITTAVLTRT